MGPNEISQDNYSYPFLNLPYSRIFDKSSHHVTVVRMVTADAHVYIVASNFLLIFLNSPHSHHKSRENPFKLKPEEKAKVVHVGNCVTFVIITGLLVAKRQPELLGVDWSRGASLDVLWEGMLHTYRSFLLSEELTVEPEAGREFVPRSAKGVSTAPVEAVDISPQLKSFCSDYITALGIALDVAIRVGHEEYEAGFNEAMYTLSKGGAGPTWQKSFPIWSSRKGQTTNAS